ncbi:MAG: methionine ABC transporter ATP-binding protein [Succinatimonas sp.]|nr:methionine ABC transporter ATP-binding protein [Succinatimonas sp.]MCI7025680.1 methionine ABC transporter ATP-binding protein [Succinatimonas sp.]
MSDVTTNTVNSDKTIISFENLSKRYEKKGQTFVALDNVTFKVNKGDVYGLIGFSGAGKSTLLRMVNALETPTEGKVFVKGVDLTSLKESKLREIRKDIGMIFQEFNLLETKTVFDNIAIPLVLRHENKQKIKARVEELLKFVGLEDKAKALPGELSGGQKQRVGIARALATEPEILLCDEATSALDPDTTESILNLLARVNKELNVTILFVTHTIRVVQKLCNKVAILEHGKLIENGSVIDIFSKPKSTIAKRFVETVIPSKIPESIVAELKKYEANYKVIRIFFHAEHATDDVIWQINAKLGVHTNVMFASVTELQGRVLSIITLQLTGNEEDFKKVEDYINSHGIAFEEVPV